MVHHIYNFQHREYHQPFFGAMTFDCLVFRFLLACTFDSLKSSKPQWKYWKNQSIRIMAFYPQPFANQVFLNFWELKVGSQLNWFLHYRDKIQKGTKAQIYKKTELKSNEIWQYMYTLPESESSLLNFIVVKRKKNIWFVNFQCTHAQKMAICQPHYAFLKP